MLRDIAKRPRTGEIIELSAADPLNLTGIVLPGPRIPAVTTHSVSFTDGAVTPAGVSSGQAHPVLTA
jgi:ATP-dependent Lhr-like helicase